MHKSSPLDITLRGNVEQLNRTGAMEFDKGTPQLCHQCDANVR